MIPEPYFQADRRGTLWCALFLVCAGAAASAAILVGGRRMARSLGNEQAAATIPGPAHSGAVLDDAQPAPVDKYAALKPLFDAIRLVESAGNDLAIGDDGYSRGPYQIGRAYWADACKELNVEWSYDHRVWDRQTCEIIMLAYWRRYCGRALRELDFETLARVHNGGPNGEQRASTDYYWKKVKVQLNGTGQ